MNWTVEMVEARLREAADTLRRLPKAGPRGYHSTMPAPVRSLRETWCDATAAPRPAAAAPAAIDRLDEVLDWMWWLEEDEIRVLWARAAGVPWRPLCRRLGCGRTKAWRIWVAALAKLAARLERRAAVPSAAAKKHLNSENK